MDILKKKTTDKFIVRFNFNGFPAELFHSFLALEIFQTLLQYKKKSNINY